MDEKTTDVTSLQYTLNMLTVLKLGRQHTKEPLAGAIGPFFMSLLYPPNP